MVCSPEQTRINAQKSTGPRTERGKAIASRNATKHGLLVTKPPLLASESLETFQEVVQGLVDYYGPDGPLEWHCINTISICIQRQHRVWQAEAALGDRATLPPIAPRYTDEKYPHKNPKTGPNLSIAEEWGQYHPSVLQQERKTLERFLKKCSLALFPVMSRYLRDEWEEWLESLENEVEKFIDTYPLGHQPGFPSPSLLQVDRERWKQKYHECLKQLQEEKHLYAQILDYKTFWLTEWLTDLRECSKAPSKKELAYFKATHERYIKLCRQRLREVIAIQQEIAAEQERHDRETAERQRQTTVSISAEIELLSRYEVHIANQMKAAIAQLQELQERRLKTAE